MAGEKLQERKLVAITDICGHRMILKDAMFTMSELPEGATADHLISVGAARWANNAELHEGRANVANADMITELDSLRQQCEAKTKVINNLNAEISKAKSLGHVTTDAQTSASKAEVEKMKQTIADLQKKVTDSEAKRFTLQKNCNDQDDLLRQQAKEIDDLNKKSETLQQALDEATKPVDPVK